MIHIAAPCTDFVIWVCTTFTNNLNHSLFQDYSIFKGYLGGDLKIICNAGVGGIKSFEMCEDGVAQGGSKCNIEFKMCS